MSLVGRNIGKYEIVDVIGHGGMASVYLGYQQDLDRKAAIKVLPPHPGLDAQFIERFQLEARTIAKLQHPHILPLYDYGTEGDVLYLVMPYIDGGSLDKLLADGRLDILYTERILREVASALDFAHRRGVIHRDIKPANILIDSEGHTLLADFGIAKLVGSTTNLTGTGVVGTPAYMSPEQARGGVVDARADLYSFGVLVYEMLTGRHPFSADNAMQILLKHIQDPVPTLTGNFPAGLDGVMKRILAKDPDDRFQTATAFAEAFSAAVHQGETGFSTPAPVGGDTARFATQKLDIDPSTKILSPVELPRQGGNNNTTFALLGAAAVVVLFIVGTVLLLSTRQNTAQDPTPTSGAVAVNVSPEPTAEIISSTPVPEARNFGQVSFSTVSSIGDTAAIRLNNVRPPASGSIYVAWLVNTRDDTALNMGRVPVDAAGTGAASFQSEEAVVLPALYNAVMISEELVANATSETPTGTILYESTIPLEITDFLREMFVESERGLSGRGLLDSAISEAGIGAQHAGLAARASNIGGMLTHVEHTLNILLGTEEDFNGNGRGENPGGKIGLYPILDAMQEMLTAATSVEGASLRAQTEAESISVCLNNVREWADEVIELERAFLTAESLETIAEDQARSTVLANQITTGIDLNGVNGVEPFEGECGLEQIPVNGLLIATMEISERSQ